jgi:FdrA protein
MVLMQISSKILEMEGVNRVAIMMATDNNKPFIAYSGFQDPSIDSATASDLVIALETVDAATMDDTIARIDALLKERGQRRKRGRRFASLEGACDGFDGANLAVISVPGQFAAREARKAIGRGLNVLLFSDNVPLNDEIDLKRRAGGKGVLLMGPDCGTAVINGVGLGFANAVRKGPVGIVGASGTGMQECCMILEQAGGIGVSQAIGTGGRDLSEEVGGLTALAGLDFLAQDPDTEAILFLSKPPSKQVSARIVERIRSIGKKAVVCFLGLEATTGEGQKDIVFAETIEEAALAMVRMMGSAIDRRFQEIENRIAAIAAAERLKFGSGQKFLRGVFSGGSFCYESMIYLRRQLANLHSNSPVSGIAKLADAFISVEHTLVDLGEDEFTRGRVHPMIDPSPVADRLRKEAAEESVAVVLFDVVLGYGAHPDPAGVLVPAIGQVREQASRAGRHVSFVTHVCGTDGDPQGREEQEEKLRNAGVRVMATNLQATQVAAELLKR